MEVIGPAEGVLTNEQIITQHPEALNRLITAGIDSVYSSEKQLLITNARQLIQYIQGQHYNVPGVVNSAYGDTTDFVPYDFFTAANNGETTGPDVKLCPPINVIGGDCFKFTAVMGKSAPRVKAVADDPQSSSDITRSRDADACGRDIWIKANVDRKWKALSFNQYATGPSFIRTFWRTDKRKYGETQEPVIELSTTPEGIPVPNTVGTRAYANGDAEIKVYSVLDVDIAYNAVDLEDSPFLYLECMRSKWDLLDEFKGTDDEPGPLERYRDGEVPDDDMSGASSTAAEARDAITEPSGSGRARKPNDWRFSERFLEPYLFQAIPEPALRAVFQRQFSDGLYIARVGTVTVKIDNRKRSDEWVVCRVGRGERIMERPIGADGLPINRAINDIFGMAIETVLRAITQTIMDAQLIDRQAMNTKEAVPAEIILAALQPGTDLNKQIFQIPPARLGDQVLPLLDRARALMQDITGIRPEIAGGGQPTQTYREAKQRRDQALAQLAPQADAQREAAAKVFENVIKLRARYGSGTIKSIRKGAYGPETDIVDMANLQESGWHAEADDNFPMTLADRRDAVFSMLKDFPPEVQQALSILDPLNIEEIFELLEVPGFESAVRDQVEKTLNDIQQLLQAEATPDPAGGPAAPSVPPDPFELHAIVVGVLAKWLTSKTGQQQRNTNPGGFANVEARWNAQNKLANPAPPPPPPPIRASLALTQKMEDRPDLLAEVLQNAGIQGGAPPPPAAGQPPIGNPGPLTAPSAAPSAPIQQESPIPKLTPPPNGHVPFDTAPP